MKKKLAQLEEIVNNAHASPPHEIRKKIADILDYCNDNDKVLLLTSAIAQNENLATWLSRKWFDYFWDDLLEMQVVRLCYHEGKAIYLMPQNPEVRSFDLIMGAFYEGIAENNYFGLNCQKGDILAIVETERTNLEKAEKYGSCQALTLFNLYALENFQETKNEAWLQSAATICEKLLIHKTPGYIQKAMLCYIAALYCPNQRQVYASRALSALYTAQFLEPISANEINNAYSGASLEVSNPFGFKNLDESIQALIQRFSLDQYCCLNAKQRAKQEVEEKYPLDIELASPYSLKL